MKDKPLRGNVVVVWWFDARGLRGVADPEDMKKKGGLPMMSAGVLISDEGDAVRFAQDYYFDGGEEAVRDIEIIPKAYITKMRKWKA